MSPRPVSLVLPTLDAGPVLEEVLDALDRQQGAPELERVAVDSGSRDGTLERLRSRGFAVWCISRGEFNHGATRDFAISKCRGEVVVLLNQDAVPADAAWLRRLLEPYDDPRVAGVYCRQIPRPDCNPVLAARIRNWSAGKTAPVVQRVASEAAFARLPPLERLARAAFDNVASSLRRSVWQEIPFGRRSFGEDVAWGKRAVLAGWSLVFQPASAVVHSHDRSPLAEGKRLYCDHQNLNELFGLLLVPTLRDALAGIRPRRRELLRLLDDLPPERRRALRRWVTGYAVAERLGLFLGAKSRSWLGRGGAWSRFVDRWLKQGI